MKSKDYKFARIRTEDYNKIREKKKAIEDDLRIIFRRPMKVKMTELFNIAANSNWELPDFRNQLVSAVRKKKRRMI